MFDTQRLTLGFTLIEMLVVLVIVSMTTTLLMTGLANTWTHFERLGARDLTLSAGMHGITWFRRSFQGAVMYHPESKDFIGNPSAIRLTTFYAPFSESQIPQKIQWEIEQDQDNWVLTVTDLHQQTSYAVDTFNQKAEFEYLSTGGWQSQHSPDRNSLPKAIRILVAGQEWIRVYATRPVLSDLPAEYPAFGVYEF